MTNDSPNHNSEPRAAFNDERVSAFVDGELTQAELAEFEQQLINSPEYQKAVDRMRQVHQAMKSLDSIAEPGLGADFARRVMDQIDRPAATSSSRMLPSTADAPDAMDDARPRWATVARPVAYAVMTLTAATFLFFFSSIVNPVFNPPRLASSTQPPELPSMDANQNRHDGGEHGNPAIPTDSLAPPNSDLYGTTAGGAIAGAATAGGAIAGGAIAGALPGEVSAHRDFINRHLASTNGKRRRKTIVANTRPPLMDDTQPEAEGLTGRSLDTGGAPDNRDQPNTWNDIAVVSLPSTIPPNRFFDLADRYARIASENRTWEFHPVDNTVAFGFQSVDSLEESTKEKDNKNLIDPESAASFAGGRYVWVEASASTVDQFLKDLRNENKGLAAEDHFVTTRFGRSDRGQFAFRSQTRDQLSFDPGRTRKMNKMRLAEPVAAPDETIVADLHSGTARDERSDNLINGGRINKEQTSSEVTQDLPHYGDASPSYSRTVPSHRVQRRSPMAGEQEEADESAVESVKAIERQTDSERLSRTESLLDRQDRTRPQTFQDKVCVLFYLPPRLPMSDNRNAPTGSGPDNRENAASQSSSRQSASEPGSKASEASRPPTASATLDHSTAEPPEASSDRSSATGNPTP